jgi:hypothetical protein
MVSDHRCRSRTSQSLFVEITASPEDFPRIHFYYTGSVLQNLSDIQLFNYLKLLPKNIEGVASLIYDSYFDIILIYQ